MKNIIILIIVVMTLSSLTLLVINKNKGYEKSGTSTVAPTPAPTVQPSSPAVFCRKSVLSDNLMYEDRLNMALKTCKGTQICTYDDFRSYSQANGAYMPDWRSESYIKLETEKCLTRLPIEPTATHSETSQ